MDVDAEEVFVEAMSSTAKNLRRRSSVALAGRKSQSLVGIPLEDQVLGTLGNTFCASHVLYYSLDWRHRPRRRGQRPTRSAVSARGGCDRPRSAAAARRRRQRGRPKRRGSRQSRFKHFV